MFTKKAVFLISLVLLSGLVANASAAIRWWKGKDGVNKYWTDPNNWWGGVLTSTDTANLNDGAALQTLVENNPVLWLVVAKVRYLFI